MGSCAPSLGSKLRLQFLHQGIMAHLEYGKLLESHSIAIWWARHVLSDSLGPAEFNIAVVEKHNDGIGRIEMIIPVRTKLDEDAHDLMVSKRPSP